MSAATAIIETLQEREMEKIADVYMSCVAMCGGKHQTKSGEIRALSMALSLIGTQISESSKLISEAKALRGQG